MTNKDIYLAALSILAQNAPDGENADYEERAPYLIATFCSDALETDTLMRKALGISSAKSFNEIFLPLEDSFPLLDRFASAAAKYLAAMLVIDEDSELSEKLFEMCCDGMALIRKELPYALESIVDKYN